MTNYLIEPTFHLNIGTGQDIIVNKDSWNSLPPDIQAILQTAAIAYSSYFYRELRYNDLLYREKMIDYGIEVITLPESELMRIRPLAVEVWDELATKSPESAKRIQMYKDTCKLVGKPME